jgi:anion transporter
MSITDRINIPAILSFTAVITGAILLVLPIPDFMPGQRKAAGLAIITIGLFATGSMPEYLTALLFFLIAMLFGVAPASVVFSGFESTALWLVFGGLVLVVAVMTTGLGKRIASKIAGKLEGSYTKLIAGMTLVGVCFSFLMPSAMGRVILLVPISVAIANHFGFRENSNGRTGVIFATILGCFIPAFSILPANVPNIILAGMAESQFGLSPMFGEYLLLHFPILGLAKACLIVVLIVWLYPDQPVKNLESDLSQTKPLSREESILAVVLAVLLLLWITDFAHHISPAWVALAGAFFFLLPGIGLVNGQHFNTKINFGSLFFVAGVIGLGGMIKHSGLGTIVGGKLIASLPIGHGTPFATYMSVALVSTLTGLVTTASGVPAVITPLTREIAEVSGLSIKVILMLQVLGFSTIILPYQASPVVVALQVAGCKTRDMVKPIMLLAVITYGVLLPINYLWWKVLGWI